MNATEKHQYLKTIGCIAHFCSDRYSYPINIVIDGKEIAEANTRGELKAVLILKFATAIKQMLEGIPVHQHQCIGDEAI